MKFTVLVIGRGLSYSVFNQVPRRFLTSILDIVSIIVIISNRLLLLVLTELRKLLVYGLLAFL